MAMRRAVRLAASRTAAAHSPAYATIAPRSAPPAPLLALQRAATPLAARRAGAAPWRAAALHVSASVGVRAPDDLPSAPPGATPAEEAVRKEFAHMTGSDARPLNEPLPPPDAEREIPAATPTGVDVMRSRLPGASGAADWRLDAERRGVATHINAGVSADAAHARASPGASTASDEPQWGASAVGYGETRPDAPDTAASAAAADAAAERMSDWQPVLEEEATVATAAPFDRFDVGAAPHAQAGNDDGDDIFHTPAAAHAAFDDATSATRSATAAAAAAASDAAAAPDAAEAFVAGAVPGASAARAAREGAIAAAFADAEEMAREMKNAAFGGRDQAAEAEAFSAEGRTEGPAPSEANDSPAVAAARTKAAAAGVGAKMKRAASAAAHDVVQAAEAVGDVIARELGVTDDKGKGRTRKG